ncbi:MAG: DUF1573 domain-containing protein [Bacteroidota bacterium]
MKKTLIILAVGLIAAFQLTAQTSEKPVNPNAPVITFDKVLHDYGTILQNSDGTCEFKFTNDGKEPLILSRPKSSCGCTVPTWPKQPVLPGKGETIKVTYSTNRVGPFNKTVTIYCNASNSPIKLQIKGKVIKQAAEVVPEKETNTGATPVNK